MCPGVADAAAGVQGAQAQLLITELDEEGVVPEVGSAFDDVDALEVAVYAIGEAIHGSGVAADLSTGSVVDAVGDGIAKRAYVCVADREQPDAAIEGPA